MNHSTEATDLPSAGGGHVAAAHVHGGGCCGTPLIGDPKASETMRRLWRSLDEALAEGDIPQAVAAVRAHRDQVDAWTADTNPRVRAQARAFNTAFGLIERGRVDDAHQLVLDTLAATFPPEPQENETSH